MLQNSKREIIDIIIDDIKMLNQLSLIKLMQLFESMSIEENKKSFILMNENEKNENVNERASMMRSVTSVPRLYKAEALINSQ